MQMDALRAQKNELRIRRNELREKISELQKCSQLLSHEVTQKHETLAELESRVKFLKREKAEMETQQIVVLKRELEMLNAEAQLLTPHIDEIKWRMMELEQKIDDLEKRVDNQSDIVFKDFCSRIGIANIRVYEERELAMHTEKRDRINDISHTIDRWALLLALCKRDRRHVSVAADCGVRSPTCKRRIANHW